MTSRGGVASVQPAERRGRFGSFPRFAGLFAKCAVWDSVTGARSCETGSVPLSLSQSGTPDALKKLKKLSVQLDTASDASEATTKKVRRARRTAANIKLAVRRQLRTMTPSAGGSARRTAPPTPARTRRPWNWGGRVGRLGPRRSPDGSGQCSPPRPLKPAGPTSKSAIRTAARARASTTLTSLGNRAEVIGADWDMPIATHTLQEEPGELESNEGRPGCKLRVCQPAAMPTSASPASPSLLRL